MQPNITVCMGLCLLYVIQRTQQQLEQQQTQHMAFPIENNTEKRNFWIEKNSLFKQQ